LGLFAGPSRQEALVQDRTSSAPRGATRLSYAASDVAGQLLFCWVIWYVPYFYTDICKIPAAAVAAILLATRFLDALDAPLWGILVDRTRSRWGKSRPWFLWLSLPFGIFGVLTFLAPGLGYSAKLGYAAVTYAGCNILFTGINTPVTSILPALTADPKERLTLTTFRMLGSKLGVLIVNLAGLGLVRYLGHGNDRKGFVLTVSLFAVASVALFLIAFCNLREIVVPSRPQSVRETFGAMKGNWPWLIVVTSTLLFWMGFISRITVAPHFFKYVLHRPDLLGLANGLDFASLATAIPLPWLCRIMPKARLWAVGLAGMVLGQSILWLGAMRGHDLGLCLTGWTVGFVFSGAAMTLPFSMLADTVDYGEWKRGVRAAGLLTAIGGAFCFKVGAGLGGAVPMWLLHAGGYLEGKEQPPAVVAALDWGIVGVPAVCFALALLPALFYGRFERLEPQIHAALEQRRTGQDSLICDGLRDRSRV
jgi:sugar (glycoside-pentoside-hexuronide) transporter